MQETRAEQHGPAAEWGDWTPAGRIPAVTRNNLTCVCDFNSPISSRNSVPSPACSKYPSRVPTVPVQAPSPAFSAIRRRKSGVYSDYSLFGAFERSQSCVTTRSMNFPTASQDAPRRSGSAGPERFSAAGVILIGTTDALWRSSTNSPAGTGDPKEPRPAALRADSATESRIRSRVGWRRGGGAPQH
jgi:hypothetical protein